MTCGLSALDGGSQTLVHYLVDSVLPGRVIGLLGYACCALSGRPPTGNAVRVRLVLGSYNLSKWSAVESIYRLRT